MSEINYSKNNISLISKILNAGSDAQSDMFLITFSPFNENDSDFYNGITSDELTVRADSFSSPEIKINNVEIPYQSSFVVKNLPSTNVEKTVTFSFRIDSNFRLYKFLLDKSLIGTNGELDTDDNEFDEKYIFENDNKAFNIKVEVINPIYINSTDKKSSEITSSVDLNNDYSKIYSYYFTRCFISQIPRVQFGYENAKMNPISVQFTYSKVKFE